jgi:DNA relaxase NicK
MHSPLNKNTKNATAQPASQTPAGGVLPRLVIRGETNTKPLLSNESLHDGERILLVSGRGGYASPIFLPIPDETKPENIAHIDWLAFTIKGNGSREEHLSFRETLNGLFNISPSEWKGTKSGWNGYKHRVNLGCYGLLAYGGKAQKNTTHIEINGHGCALVNDWEQIYEWGQLTGCTITRCDLAHDDFEGKTVNINICQGWYSDGLFNSNGRPPKPFLYDDCDTGDGKTYEVGSRKSGKLIRMYEKGKEQGDPNDPWFRVELELRNQDRKIPWDILVKPGQYLAGAYKALHYLSEEQIKLRTTKKQKDMTYEQLVQWVRTSAGKALNVIIQENDGDLSAVFNLLVRDGIPNNIINDGCLSLVE